MPTVGPFPTLRTKIAGIPVVELARRYTTPFYVYDAAKIVERIADLRAFDVIRYAQKACSNLAILDLVRRSGVLVDTVSAGEIRRALAAGYEPHGDPPPLVYTADIFDAESLDLVRSRAIHVNAGSPDMIEQLAKSLRDGTSRCGSTQVSDMDTVRRPIRAVSNPSTASGTSSWKSACGESTIMDCRSRASTCTSARARTWSTWHRSAGPWKKRL